MLMRQIAWNLDTEAFVGHARLGRTPSFFQSERGISFIESVDGLDCFKAALLIRPDLIRVVLKQYRGNPQDSTIVYLSQDFHDVDEITALSMRSSPTWASKPMRSFGNAATIRKHDSA
jgi:hypothetical protein